MIKTLEKESLKIFSYNFELLGIISDYESLIYLRFFRECGNFEMHINKNKKNVEKLTTDVWMMLGNHNEKCFIIETIVENFSDGKEELIVKGTDLKGLMKRRITYTDNFDRVEKTQAENVMKHYVINHFIDSRLASDTTVQLLERNVDILKVAETQNRGPITVWQSRFENVHDVLKHISEDSGLGWTVYADLINKKFVFDSLQGVNRSIEQKDVPQILFVKSKMNLKESNRYRDLSGLKNVAYVGGKGENEDRPIVVRGETAGINRREVFIDLNNISDMDELNTEGDKKLAEYKELNSSEGKVYSIENMEYEKDWFLGDKVSIKINKAIEHKNITAIKEIYERNNMDVDVTFGDKMPTIIDELKKEEGVVS